MAVFQNSPTTCPLCGLSAATGGSSPLFEAFLLCSVCGGHFLVSHAPPAYAAKYFSETGSPSLIRRLTRPLLSWFLALRVFKVRSLIRGNPRARVLDYGCGTGTLVAELRREGIDTVGYDPSSSAVALARQQGIPVFAEVPAGPFDLIMFWHSLEHIDAPLALIQSVRPLLAPEGKLLIAVPNAASWEAHLAKDRWFHYDYPFHRVHFTPRAIRLMLERAGFRVSSVDFFNPEYTFSGLAQTFLNFLLPKNMLYSVVSHRRFTLPRPKAAAVALCSIVLGIAFSPLLLGVWVLAVLAGKSGAMIVLAEQAR